MTTISDEQLYTYTDRLKDKVVVITGAGNGIGRETAIQFAQYGAKVVIGDRDISGAGETVAEILRAGGDAIAVKCDVLIWEDQITMFDLAVSKFGTVDIVVPNAGVTEIGEFDRVSFTKDRPVKPNLTTIQVNLVGVLYTTHLALHYLELKHPKNALKALVLLGSMASWNGVPRGSMYAASKHAVFGFMRSLYPRLNNQGIRLASIHPFFADTAIVPDLAKLAMSGIPKVPVPRIAGAIIYAATDINMESSGSAWLLNGNLPVFQVPRDEFKLGVYKMIDELSNGRLEGTSGLEYYKHLGHDLSGILGKKLLLLGVGIAAVRFLVDNRGFFTPYAAPFFELALGRVI